MAWVKSWGKKHGLLVRLSFKTSCKDIALNGFRIEITMLYVNFYQVNLRIFCLKYLHTDFVKCYQKKSIWNSKITDWHCQILKYNTVKLWSYIHHDLYWFMENFVWNHYTNWVFYFISILAIFNSVRTASVV